MLTEEKQRKRETEAEIKKNMIGHNFILSEKTYNFTIKHERRTS